MTGCLSYFYLERERIKVKLKLSLIKKQLSLVVISRRAVIFVVVGYLCLCLVSGIITVWTHLFCPP